MYRNLYKPINHYIGYMIRSAIFTQRELNVINKKIENKKLNQTDSNYLYKFIRPKLKEIISLDAKDLLNKMEYNQKITSIENKIKKILLESIKNIDSIILYGSAIQTNYKEYKDVDMIIVTKKKIYKINKEKWEKIKELKDMLKKQGIISDIQIISKLAFKYNSARNPDLIYQLKDHKVIYGKLKIPKKLEIYNADLHMKLDWSNIYYNPTGEEIYRSLRNTFLVRLLLNKIVDNKKLKESLYEELGKNLIERLKTNKESQLDRKIALNYLNELIKRTREEIKGGLWEKIELSR
jgi:predicted nucleotidyltransferase